MSAITKDDKIVTASMLQDYHDQHVAPFLGGNVLGAQSNFKNSDIYSTTERIVGCWTDGRPLYQKTISYSLASNPGNGGSINLPFSSYGLTAARIKRVDGFIQRNNNETATPIDSHDGWGNAWYDYTNSRITIYFQTGYTDVPATIYLTIQYTKTTDAAGSYYLAGENDYSTDEKIIGKWIDGKNIYRKTFAQVFATGTTVLIQNAIAINAYGYVSYKSTNNIEESVALLHRGGSNFSEDVEVYNDNGNVTFIMSAGAFASSKYGIVTIEYTKTS